MNPSAIGLLQVLLEQTNIISLEEFKPLMGSVKLFDLDLCRELINLRSAPKTLFDT
jgi:hypothetical protein